MERKGLGLKEKAAYATAVISFVFGWGLTIAGFIMGDGDIKDSVLWVLGQALIYCASVFGVTLYFSNSMAKFRADARKYMDRSTRDNEDAIETDEYIEY